MKDDDGQLYFATSDTEVDHLDSTAISAEFVNRHMSRSPSRRIVLLLDCCYSGAFSRGTRGASGQGVALAERFDGRGQVVITASNAMEYAFEGEDLSGEGRPSVFTAAVVEGLETGAADRDGDSFISIDELYDYVYEHVRESKPNQTPSKWTYDLQGDLYVARNPRPNALEPVELPSEVRDAMESRLSEVREGAVRELAALAEGRHRSLAIAARRALEVLGEDDSRKVSRAAADALALATVAERRRSEAVDAEFTGGVRQSEHESTGQHLSDTTDLLEPRVHERQQGELDRPSTPTVALQGHVEAERAEAAPQTSRTSSLSAGATRWARLAQGSVLGGGLLYLANSFLHWQQVSLSGFTGSQTEWAGIGLVAVVLALLLLAWEFVRLLVRNADFGGFGVVTPTRVSAGLALLLLVFTAITFQLHSSFRYWPAWFGLGLSVAIAAAAAVRARTALE